MAYYVTVQNNGRTLLAAGPFNRHGDAERTVGAVRHLIHDRYPREAPWVGYGTSRVKTGRPVAKFKGEELDEYTTADPRWW